MKPAVAAFMPTLLTAALIAGCGSSQTQATHQGTSTNATAGSRTSAAAVRASYVAPVTTIQLVGPQARYAVYVNALLKLLRTQVSALHGATTAGSLKMAEADWTRAHFTYLEIGQDDDAYGIFGDLGQQIDGMAAGLPHTVRNPNFTGFHKVELDLWGHHSVTAAAADSARLVSLIHRLTPKQVQQDLPLTAAGVDAWVLRCHEILEDALRDSLTQDDDYGSNSDLASLAADVNATHEMLALLAPLIETRRPKILSVGVSDLRSLTRTITKDGGPGAHLNLRAIPSRERQQLDAATSAATETFAPVSEILQVAVPGS